MRNFFAPPSLPVLYDLGAPVSVPWDRAKGATLLCFACIVILTKFLCCFSPFLLPLSGFFIILLESLPTRARPLLQDSSNTTRVQELKANTGSSRTLQTTLVLTLLSPVLRNFLVRLEHVSSNPSESRLQLSFP